MDIAPEMWVVIILGVTAIAGALMWWSGNARKK
jgi:hypothetical protein